MNPRVKQVVANNDFTLLVYFTNGEKGIYDVKPLLNMPVFQFIKDISNFKTVSVGNGQTVCWGDDLDICPDTIYIDSKKINN
jgi:hypothetical protein